MSDSEGNKYIGEVFVASNMLDLFCSDSHDESDFDGLKDWLLYEVQ